MPMVIQESSAIGEHSRFRRNRNHNQNQSQPISETDPNPDISNATRSKPTISSLLFSTFNSPINNNDSPSTHKKKNFSSATFRGLGCTASSQVSVPAVIRSSADWEAKKVKKKKQRGKKNKGPNSSVVALSAAATTTTTNATNMNMMNNNQSSSALSLSLSSSCVAVPDVWCGPGIGLTTDAASVDYVVSRRPVSGRGKVDGEKMSHRERPSYSVRRMVTPEEIPFLDSGTASGIPNSRLDAVGSRHRHAQHAFPEGLAEIVLFQHGLLRGRRSQDRYRDWRLDIDDMTYEELLELGDRIGYVSTGLKKDQMARCLRKFKLSILDNFSPNFLTEKEKTCSICQEEYETDDEMGKLNCEHFFHSQCIEQWLQQKNACPICKTQAVSPPTQSK